MHHIKSTGKITNANQSKKIQHNTQQPTETTPAQGGGINRGAEIIVGDGDAVNFVSEGGRGKAPTRSQRRGGGNRREHHVGTCP